MFCDVCVGTVPRGIAQLGVLLVGSLCELHSSLCLVFLCVCGIAQLGMSLVAELYSRIVGFLSQPRRTFVGLDGGFTVIKSGEQAVVRGVETKFYYCLETQLLELQCGD